MRTLLLFDIDGTLLHGAADAHRDAMHAALRSVHGVDAKAHKISIDPAGRTDHEIARAILLDAGVSADRIDELSEAVREECCRVYTRTSTANLAHTVQPGIARLLERLAADRRALLGLLTGNYEPVARVKLARAGVGQYFPRGQGAFGSDAEDRAALPAIARRRAGSRGSPHPRSRTIVIGDTPRDIACAHADGVRCLALATGPYGPEALSAADEIVSDARELGSVLEDLLAAR